MRINNTTLEQFKSDINLKQKNPMKSNILIITILLSLIIVSLSRQTFSQKTSLDGKTITYGSIIKLFHPQTSYMLHSHGIRFGMGGIYSVTGYKQDDLGSYWQIREKLKSRTKTYKDNIQCGDIITLTSVIIDYYLQTQQTAVGLTSELDQFVRGITKDGVIDDQVNWNIICETKPQRQPIVFGDMIRLKHSITGKFASLDKSYVYHQGNCGRGCVIAGQLEPHAIDIQDDRTIFQLFPGMRYETQTKEDVKMQ